MLEPIVNVTALRVFAAFNSTQLCRILWPTIDPLRVEADETRGSGWANAGGRSWPNDLSHSSSISRKTLHNVLCYSHTTKVIQG